MPRYLRLISDIHLNIDADLWKRTSASKRTPSELDALWYPTKIDTDYDTVFVVAGDLWENNHAFERRYSEPQCWLERVSAQFNAVVLVLGNHDYWNGSLQRAPIKTQQSITNLGLTNVHLLEKSSVVIGDIKLLGGTLWTDLNKGDPNVITFSPSRMNDYKKIKVGLSSDRRRLRPSDLYEVHRQTVRYIHNDAVRDNEQQKVIVVTHMAPSYQSIDPVYANEVLLNHSYYSDLTNLAMQVKDDVDMWLHGHVHTPCQYDLTGTRIKVACNPRGYGIYENTGYDPNLIFDLETL